MKRVSLMFAVLAGGIAIGGVSTATVSREAPPGGRALADLLKEQAQTAAESRALAERRFEQGLATIDDVLAWSRREIDAKLELATTKAERVALLEKYVEEAKRGEAIAAQRAKIAVGTTLDVQAAHYERLGAEIRLARAQSE